MTEEGAETMILQNLTWQEIAKVDWSRTIVLIPVGATEQHGPHLPVDTDTFIVNRLAEEVEKANPLRMMLTPAMWLGHSPHHLSFGGTLSAYHQVYIAMIRSICNSYIGNGARNLWILNGHGGNRAPLSIVLQELKNEHCYANVYSTDYWHMAQEEIGAIRESGFGGLGHACELETSLYFYLNESRVRASLIQDDGQQPEGTMVHLDMLSGNTISRFFNFEELTESGVFGKPSLASKAKGELFFRAITARLVQFSEALLNNKGEANNA
ncbi:creatininase family protein [Paenibacillus eucommiae]|uniref:Creatinine amidohydrolase n=1 Tax=Paenibacillus eucommiae TaxID=1355755 RepID=A0ABS4IRN3_9BACL|nr:creatininase family protein [Paenibacillus eucommiae]MBP1990227.1 creatinine amidohydrolase [Paenibacillus eucommiae]